MSSVPFGWENRNNQMSEKDMKLGGNAANKFASKNAYGDGSAGYKTSEEVKAFYMQQIEQKQEQEQHSSASVPIGWEDRQRSREVQAKQYGVFSNKSVTPPRPTSAATASLSLTNTNTMKTSSAEAALVKVATTTLDSMAQCLEQNPVALAPGERAAFAAAMQRAMAAIAKCR